MSASRYAVVRRLSRVLLLPLHGYGTTNDRVNAMEEMTTTVVHRIDSSSPCMIIVRKSSSKFNSKASIKNEQNTQAISTIVTSNLTGKKQRRSLFNMRRRAGKDGSSNDDQRICTKDNCLTCCKKFTAFMFSRVGLFFVMIGYVALGGWLFQALEARNEQDMRRSMSEKLNSTLYKLWGEILRVNSFPYHDKKVNFTLYATAELEKFETTVIQQVHQGFDGRTRPDADPDWNYFGAILYAVTLVSTIGYGHITTKTVQGKIATILYSAFGIPLMMLFVANIGSTMAKLFAFVFSRLTMIFCCRWKSKTKRKSFKSRESFNRKSTITDENPPIEKLTTKSSLKRSFDYKDNTLNQTQNRRSSPKSSISDITINNYNNNNNNNNNDTSNMNTKQLPADVRLDMLTGVPINLPKSRSLTSSASTVTSERSKDAIVRMNELIRQSSVQDDENFNDNHVKISSNTNDQHRRSNEISPIQFYIDETNKLTNNLHSTIDDQIITKSEKENIQITNLDDLNIQPVNIIETSSVRIDDRTQSKIESKNENKKLSKKQLKRSKSESNYNRKLNLKADNNSNVGPSSNDNVSNKPTHRRFFTRKLKKQPAIESEHKNQNSSLEQEPNDNLNESNRRLTRKSLSFNDNMRSLAPPPNYEESTTMQDTTPLPTVTWKPHQQAYSTKPTLEFQVNSEFEDDDGSYEEEKMSVPLLVTVFVIPLYLTLGAILFNIWEKWGFLNSFYFCFITLTTIGFGDFVPGSALTVSAAKEKLISAALYILLGLVLIAMCFNLMKEQLSQKVKQVAGKWGILEF